MATNFEVKGKLASTPKGHYVVLREHEKHTEHELTRLKEKLNKHIALPMEKAHKPESKGASQKDAPLPNMRKY